MTGHCKSCRYAVRSMIVSEDQPPLETFECLALPGQVVVIGNQIMTVFPRRTAMGWCALYKWGWRKLLSRSNG